jgi:hypothetical protein
MCGKEDAAIFIADEVGSHRPDTVFMKVTIDPSHPNTRGNLTFCELYLCPKTVDIMFNQLSKARKQFTKKCAT